MGAPDSSTHMSKVVNLGRACRVVIIQWRPVVLTAANHGSLHEPRAENPHSSGPGSPHFPAQCPASLNANLCCATGCARLTRVRPQADKARAGDSTGMSVIGIQSGGWHDSSTVTWRLAVPSHPLVNWLLEARYVEPLRADPRGEQLLATLWSYLDNDRNVKRTADALVVHENTLRYRLSRLGDLIGGKLDETNRLVELMWVRQALEVDNQPITRP